MSSTSSNAKHKLVGRIAFGQPVDKSQVYWKCPTRGCQQMHYFQYIPTTSSGITPIYKKQCEECNKNYTASHLFTSGTMITLVVVIEEKI